LWQKRRRRRGARRKEKQTWFTPLQEGASRLPAVASPPKKRITHPRERPASARPRAPGRRAGERANGT
jgi:hypothetical protein